MFHHIPALKFEPSPDANNPEEFLLYNVRIVQCTYSLFLQASHFYHISHSRSTVEFVVVALIKPDEKCVLHATDKPPVWQRASVLQSLEGLQGKGSS